MTGHQHLIAMRRAGMRPACVWVWDDADPLSARAAREWQDSPNPFAGKLFADIHIAETDVPEALDFRCLVGMHVHLFNDRSEERARRMFRAIEKAAPARLVSVIGLEVLIQGGSNG